MDFNPTVTLIKNNNVLNPINDTLHLNKDDDFKIELVNPTKYNVLTHITLNHINPINQKTLDSFTIYEEILKPNNTLILNYVENFNGKNYNTIKIEFFIHPPSPFVYFNSTWSHLDFFPNLIYQKIFYITYDDNPSTNQLNLYCGECGRKKQTKTHKFCTNCGTKY